MKYFLIAGEPSGDQHAGQLMKALHEKDQMADFAFLGGDKMAEEGGLPVVHIKDMAFMGFTQVLANLGKIRNNFKKAKKAILDYNPDAVIFVDYPGFNMRMARWAKIKGYQTLYYITPSVWAWNTKRVFKLKRYCDKLYSILPFEKDFFKKYGIEVDYVGNPVFEDIEVLKQGVNSKYTGESKQIALLPGSRKQEIVRILPVMLSVISQFEEYEFVIAAMNSHRKLYEKIIPGEGKVKLEYDKPLSVLDNSVAALVTSGTATLETALIGIPQLVCYKAGNLSYQIARRLVKVPYISLVNLILNRPAIPELIQGNCRTDYITESLKKILPGGASHRDQLEISEMVKEKLGSQKASETLAGLIVSRLKSLG